MGGTLAALALSGVLALATPGGAVVRAAPGGAFVDRGRLDGVRPGDAVVFYRTVEVDLPDRALSAELALGSGTVQQVGYDRALAASPPGVRPGDRAQIARPRLSARFAFPRAAARRPSPMAARESPRG